MPALSKKQQRFFGIVRAIQKGEQAPTTPETAKAARDMKKGDVKDFASTKHKGLPEKKVKKEESKLNEYYGMPGGMGSSASKRLRADYDDEEYLKIKAKKDRLLAAVRRGREKRKKMKEETDYKSRDKIMKKANPLHKHLYKNLHKKDKTGDVNEESKYDRYDSEKKKFAKTDKRMKFGKFYDKAKEAKNRLRPGEVKRYDKKLGKYVSNKD